MVAIALLGATLGATAARAADDPTRLAEGNRLFIRYCASCHGRDAKGNGPLAPALTPAPADLTMLSARHGSPLPKSKITEWIDGRREVRAHGPMDMPVWGERLTASGPEGDPAREALATGTLMLIVDWLASVQAAK